MEDKMDFNILHLSDLHIRDTMPLQPNLEKLLSDIEEQIQNIHKIIVVVTGDIVDQGKYNEKSESNVKEFFLRLKEILNDKFASLLIVPGNHDRVQCNSSNIIIEKLREKKDVIDNMTSEDWNYHLLSYKKFLSLEDDIYSIFYPNNMLPIEHIQTYGVEKYVNNESVILFIKIDTAWCSLGGKQDKRNLHITLSQLESLKDEYQKIKKEESNRKILTIALLHHPINWLTESDEELLYSYFINEDFLNVDVVLCGHVHDIEINNMYSTFHQITTLLTGIGWKEDTPLEKRNGHRYSIYVFNLRRNSCEAIVRKTDSNGHFDIDRDFLPDKNSKDIGKLSIPIILKNNYPYIEIPVYSDKGLNNIPLFIDKSILTNINNYSWKLSELMSNMKEQLFLYKQQALYDFTFTGSKTKSAKSKEDLKQYFDSGEPSEEARKVLSFHENQKWIYTNFSNYLYEICNCFINLFKIYFKKSEDLRIFFRYYNFKDNSSHKYVQICQQSKSNIEGENKGKNDARDVDYNGLIEKAHKMKTPLVFSSNIWYNNLEPPKWNNFITIVPIFSEYEYIKKNKKYPVITCAISIKSTTKEPFLDILNYIKIQNILNNIIASYLKTFQIGIINCAEFYFADNGGN